MLNEFETIMKNAEPLPFLEKPHFLNAFAEICKFREIIFGDAEITNIDILIVDFFKLVEAYKKGDLEKIPDSRLFLKNFYLYCENNT